MVSAEEENFELVMMDESETQMPRGCGKQHRPYAKTSKKVIG